MDMSKKNITEVIVHSFAKLSQIKRLLLDFKLIRLLTLPVTFCYLNFLICLELISTLSFNQVSCFVRGKFKKGKDKRWSAYTLSEKVYTGITVSTIWMK